MQRDKCPFKALGEVQKGNHLRLIDIRQQFEGFIAATQPAQLVESESFTKIVAGLNLAHCAVLQPTQIVASAPWFCFLALCGRRSSTGVCGIRIKSEVFREAGVGRKDLRSEIERAS